MGDMTESTMIASASDSPAQQIQEMTTSEFSNLLLEVQEQPAWRRKSDMACDYYDGKQLDSDTLRAMSDLGMAPCIENIMAPTIDAVLGLEAKTRLDWRVQAFADEKDVEIAEAMSFRMKQAERETFADRACSDAFAAQIKAGCGWVEVAREHDPFRYPYRAEYVSRNEIFWDFRGKRMDTTDWRYLIRKRWNDADVIALAFPEKAELLRMSSSGWSGFDPTMLIDGGKSTGLGMDFVGESAYTFEEQEWRDTYRKRLCLSEVWYRRWMRGHVLKTPDGRVIEFDQANASHVEAAAMGIVNVQSAMFSKVRLAWFVGPHKLADIPSPYKHDKFPYVPFFGKREDLTGVPYGLGRPMMPMQDEVNARNTKMIWLLAAKRVTMTEGVTKDSPEVVRLEAARPDAVHVLNPQKLAQGGLFKVETDFQLNAQQYSALQDKRQAIKNVAGVYSSFEGSTHGNISGIAANTLVEQSTQTLAEIMDNFQSSRALVGDLLMSMIIEDIGTNETEINIEHEINGVKKVRLNVPTPHPSGQTVLTNDLQRARLKMVLSDVPSTTSYRSQRLMALTEITKSLPPQFQGLVLDFVMAATDLPERAEIVKRIRKSLQLGDQEPPKTPEEAQALQQAQAQQQAVAELQQRDAVATVAEKEARAQKTAAEAQRLQFDIQRDQAGMNGTSPHEAELQQQLQAVIEQAQQVRNQTQEQLSQAQKQHEEELAEIRDALASAQLEADDKKTIAETDLEKARIDAETRRFEAEAEVRRAEVEAFSKHKE